MLLGHLRPRNPFQHLEVGGCFDSRSTLLFEKLREGVVSAPAAIPNQTTEYNPAPRPSSSATTPNPLSNPPIPPSGDGSTTPSLALPPSSLPPVTAPSSHLKIDPTNPSGIIPSTGQSVYEIDLVQFEGSGQPWRRPGSDIADWFNFGFDEVTYPKFLRYRQDMEVGRNALVSWNTG